jgi:pimeloyl-ACP methyl ester carboxylesterase
MNKSIGRNPDAVCGMVLVDAVHPDQLLRFSAVGIEKVILPYYLRPLVLAVSHLGLARHNKGPQYSMPKEVYDAEQAFLPKSSVTWFDESVEVRNILAQSGRYESLGDIPLIVLSSARPSLINTRPGDQDLQNTWLKLQQELTLLSGNSEIRMLKESGHYIQFDQPEVVVEAIRDICRRCAGALTSP